MSHYFYYKFHQFFINFFSMDDITEDVIPVNITDELKSSYMDYAMSVIVGRALPDARDGLKPVHRRTLYAMFRLNN